METVSITPIEKGWSPDKKYRVRTADGKDHLLRVSAHETYEKKKLEFELMERFAALGVPMCRPIKFGENDEGVYSVQEWIDGEDAEAVIPGLDPRRQYEYGLEAGRVLRLIHTLPAPPEAEDWETRMDRKLDARIKKYMDCPLRYDDDRPLLDYLASNRGSLKNRPQVWQHGDYHIGNMMVDRSGGFVSSTSTASTVEIPGRNSRASYGAPRSRPSLPPAGSTATLAPLSRRVSGAPWRCTYAAPQPVDKGR